MVGVQLVHNIFSRQTDVGYNVYGVNMLIIIKYQYPGSHNTFESTRSVEN